MKFENLISELCPNGVVYSPLGTLCKIETGKLNANAMDENGIYPFFTCDAKPFRINTYAFNTEAILVSGNGSQVGHINYYNGKFNAYQRTYVLSDFNGIHVGFLLHYLQGYLREHIYVNSRKGSVPYITLPMLQNFRIPLPPLPVQQEIVRILDNFTELTAELNKSLEEEVSARRKQYEHYRDELLTFGDDVPIFSLSKISTNCDCHRKPVTKGNREAGIYPYYGASGIVDYVSDYIFEGDYLLISEDGANLLARSTPIAFSISGKNWVNNHAHVLRFDTPVLQKYVEIYLNSLDLSKYISGGAQPKLNQDNLNKIPIPIPSNGVKHIVDVLTHFDALCNDLTSGLSAEITARQKQYEYYRDKLLTFKKLEV